MDEEQKLGATGEFPEGKISEDDEGELVFQVGHTPEGTVILDFGKPVKWIGLPPQMAISLAELLMKHAKGE